MGLERAVEKLAPIAEGVRPLFEATCARASDLARRAAQAFSRDGVAVEVAKNVKQPFVDTLLVDREIAIDHHRMPVGHQLSWATVSDVGRDSITLAITSNLGLRRSGSRLQTLRPGQSATLHPGDTLVFENSFLSNALGFKPVELEVNHRYSARYMAAIGPREPTVTLQGGQKTIYLSSQPISFREIDRAGVDETYRSGLVRFDEKGIFLSKYVKSALVNGSDIQTARRNYLNLTDEVVLPSHYPDGKAAFVRLVPTSLTRAPELSSRSSEAQAQIDRFANTGRIGHKLVDGFEAPAAGDAMLADGTWVKAMDNAPSIVFSPPNDPVLRRFIAHGVSEIRQFGLANPGETAAFTAALARRQLWPEHLTEAGMQNWNIAFGRQYFSPGCRVLIGDYLSQGTGRCLPESMLTKLLADATGQTAELVMGKGTMTKGLVNGSGHIWTHFTLPGSKTKLIYDPAEQVYGQPVTSSSLKAGRYVPLRHSLQNGILRRLPEPISEQVAD